MACKQARKYRKQQASKVRSKIARSKVASKVRRQGQERKRAREDKRLRTCSGIIELIIIIPAGTAR